MTYDTKTLKRTERGWAGHFICADRCLFRRNTLLELGETRIVISSVGLMKDYKEDKFIKIGVNRYFETMVFHARREQDRYWDADVLRQVCFDSPWGIPEANADDKANDMHEAVVTEIAERMMKGEEL